MEKRTKEDIKEAIEFFKNAKDIDSEFALADLGLAECYVIIPYYGILPEDEAYPLAKKFALLSLEKDPYLAEVYATLEIVYDVYEFNWREAKKLFEKAIYIKPSYATAHQWFSIYLRRIGRLDDSLKYSKIALELDPFSLVIRSTVADTYYDRREYEKAKEMYDYILNLDENFIGAHIYLSGIYLNKGDCEKALFELKLEKDITTQWVLLKKMFKARIYAHCGKIDEAKEIAKEIEREIEKEKETYFMFPALIYSAFGEVEVALNWTEKAPLARDGYLFLFMWEKDFDKVRKRKEFKELIYKSSLSEDLLYFKKTP